MADAQPYVISSLLLNHIIASNTIFMAHNGKTNLAMMLSVAATAAPDSLSLQCI